MSKRPYDHEWDELSRKFRRLHPICAVRGCRNPSQHTDHILNIRDAPHLRLIWSNLQALCGHHHSRLTAAYDSGRLKGACDSDGNPLDPNHPWQRPTTADAIEAANGKRVAVSPNLAATLKRRYVLGKR